MNIKKAASFELHFVSLIFEIYCSIDIHVVLRFNLHINLSHQTLLTRCIDKILTCNKIGNSFKTLKEKGRNNTWKKRTIDDQWLNISAKGTV